MVNFIKAKFIFNIFLNQHKINLMFVFYYSFDDAKMKKTYELS
jgi:hypothetical protein